MTADPALLLENAPVALLHCGPAGVLLHANAAARALCGNGAAPGQPVAGLWAAQADGTGLCGAAAAQRHLQLQCSEERWVDVSSQPLPDGGGWVLALHPSTARTTSEAESQLALAVDLGNIAVWRHDLQTQRMHYNAQAYQVLDIPPRPDGFSLDEVRAFIHPDDLPQVLASATQALAAAGPTDMEARYRRADGSWRNVMTRRVVERAADGTPLAFVGVALDVTARMAQQRRADEMTRRFELVTRSAGIGHWVLDHGAERATWSEPLRQVFQLPEGAPVPTMREWLTHWVHPEDSEAVRRRFSAWVKSGRESETVNLRALRPDGSVRHLVTHTRIEADGHAPLIFGVVIDITERRSAEQALRSAVERVALAARGAGLGTWEMDQTTGQVFWDEQMWLLRGRTPEPRAMSEAERMACVHPDDRAITYELLGRAMQDGLPFENEFRIVWPDGQVRWIASRSVAVRDEATGAQRRIGVNWDTTDKRTSEVARREREIALRENQAKSMFLARMSHELRTPLNAVLGFSQLLLAETPTADAAAQSRRRRAEHIRAAGQHLLTLINDVLDLSSLESGEVRIALAPVALAPLLAETLPLLEPLREQHGVAIHTGALAPTVMADATRLRQVLLNLLSNAIKYNRPGGVVHVEAFDLGAQVRLRVSDTGPGLNGEQLRQLFEPFNRLGREHGSDGVEGTGIGLAIVKALVERMGGTVQVSSEPGIGSVFEVRLAAALPATVASAQADVATTTTGHGPEAATTAAPPLRGTLLYVEDNPVNALIISELVARRPDLRLHIAEDGLSGVQQAQQLQPDLVLLDMQLPDIDGHEVLRRLRANPSTAQVPVIALSANAMPDDIERALRAGMADYWTKPLDFRAFMASLEGLFGPPPA